MDNKVFAALTSGVHFDKSGKTSAAVRPLVPPTRVTTQPVSTEKALPHSSDPFEAANVLRKRHRIKVKGMDVPPPLRSFRQLQQTDACPPCLTATLAGLGCNAPTPIQRQAIPILLQQRELLAVAPTGSGKTLAYLLPILLVLRRGYDKGGTQGPRAVILAPTRELVAQISRVLGTLLPGTGLHSSLLKNDTAAGTDFSKVDILLATPLLLGKLLGAERLQLGRVEYLILDEGDRLLDAQFVEQVDTVMAACTNKQLVRALFSASLPEAVEELARTTMQTPLRVTVGERGSAAASVQQRLQYVGSSTVVEVCMVRSETGKSLALRQAIAEGLPPPVLVFASSRERAGQLHRDLVLDGIPADSITADQSQSARSKAIENFRSGKTWILCATDLLARGIDFVLNTVISYDFPPSATDYVHRVGRTGRGGRQGMAITYFTEDDLPHVKPVANVIQAAGGVVPAYIANANASDLHQPRKRKKKLIEH